MADPIDHIEDTPTADELKAFAKTDFYQSWKKRFDKLANLGATGIIATPNTTFDEWLYYFKQWSELYATDYQNFKDMADDAVRSLNNGYKQNKEDYQTMASDIQTGFENTSQTMKDIMSDVANLQNQVSKLQSDTQPNAALKNGLIEETQARIAGDNNLQAQINTTQSQITDTLSKIKLTPEYFDSLDALKVAYPNGFNGLAVASVGDVMHSYVYKNGSWVDLGVYHQEAVNSKIYQPSTTVDLDNLRNEFSVLSNLNNVSPLPSDLEISKVGYGAFVYTQTAAKNETGTEFYGTQILFSIYNNKFYMRKHWGYPPYWYDWENVTDKFFNNVYYSKSPAVNLDNLKNGFYVIPDLTNVSPIPDKVAASSGAQVLTMLAPNTGDQNAAGYQLLYDEHLGNIYIRTRWGSEAKWWDWYLIGQSKTLYKVNASVDLDNVSDDYIILSDTANVANLPKNWAASSNGAILINKLIKNDNDGYIYGAQFLFNISTGKLYQRTKWGYPPKWYDWEDLVDDTTTPIDHNYSWASISLFQNVGVIGDSYASGTIGTPNSSGGYDYPMHYNISWPQIMARQNGINVYNYSRGGATAGSWLSQTDERGAAQLNKDAAKDLYLINLGINDKNNASTEPLGSSADIGTDTNSFYGNYAKIVKLVKDHAPKAKIICLGVTLSGYDAYDQAISEVASHYGARYISTSDYDLFKSGYFKDHMVAGHPTAEVYSGMANAIQSLIEKDMIDNHGYYYNAGF